MSTISIFIPSYNAEKTVGSVIDRIPSTLWGSISRVYLINDGSEDRTGSVIAAIARSNERCVAVQQPENRGYGATVQHGLALCRDDGCTIAICLHADGQYPPESIPDGIAKMELESIDLLQGSRIASGTALSGGMPLYKYICGRLLTALENRLFRLHHTDYHSGFLFYSRRLLNVPAPSWMSASFDFDLEMIALARANGFSLAEFPIPTRYADERSYLHPISYGTRVLRVLMRYMRGRYRLPADNALSKELQ